MKRITTGLICIIAATAICRAQVAADSAKIDTVYGRKAAYTLRNYTYEKTGRQMVEADNLLNRLSRREDMNIRQLTPREATVWPNFWQFSKITPNIRSMIHKAVSRSFSSKRSREIFDLLKDESHIHLIFNILPNGTVKEVTFRQRPHPTLSAMNPNEYHKFEQNLKNTVKFDNDKLLTKIGFKWARIEVVSFDFDDLIFVGKEAYTRNVFVTKSGRPELHIRNVTNALSRRPALHAAPEPDEGEEILAVSLPEFEITPQVRCMIYKAISKSFPKSRIREISHASNDNEYIHLSFRVLPDGTLQEVNFTYPLHPTLIMQSDESYRFERNIKKFVKFEPHEFMIRTGYKWGYAEFTWTHDLNTRHCPNGV